MIVATDIRNMTQLMREALFNAPILSLHQVAPLFLSPPSLHLLQDTRTPQGTPLCDLPTLSRIDGKVELKQKMLMTATRFWDVRAVRVGVDVLGGFRVSGVQARHVRGRQGRHSVQQGDKAPQNYCRVSRPNRQSPSHSISPQRRLKQTTLTFEFCLAFCPCSLKLTHSGSTCLVGATLTPPLLSMSGPTRPRVCKIPLPLGL